MRDPDEEMNDPAAEDESGEQEAPPSAPPVTMPAAPATKPEKPKKVPPKPRPRYWCIDCQRMCELEETQHDAHETREVHPCTTKGAQAIGANGNVSKKEIRHLSGVTGWDRCLGGGIVRGNIALFTGEEGIGKSTLMLVVLHAYASKGISVLYLTGEETREAVESRFFKMGLKPHPKLVLFATKSWEGAVFEITRQKPQVILVDSLQRIAVAGAGEGDEGVAALVKAIDEIVKRSNWRPALIAIGHLNAKGEAAGRRAVRHDVDIHLHFVRDEYGNLVLRSRKSRQGPSGEMGYFRFNGNRIVEVPDAMTALLAEALGNIGAVAYPAIQFARPVLVPIESAVSPPKEAGDPRVKRVAGLPDRVFEDAADLLFEASGVRFADRSVRVRAPRVGDEEIDEDASTLAVCLSLLSAAERLQLPRIAAFGSLSPTGRVQTDGMIELRVSAALKARIATVIGPPLPANVTLPEGVTYLPVASVRDLVEVARARGIYVPEAAEVIAAREVQRRRRPANRGEEPADP